MEFYDRSFALEGIEILRGKDGHGDGRTVEAYATVFDTPAEIRDQLGHYIEKIARTAFNRQIGLGIERVKVFYNHGMDLFGKPAAGSGSVPIGKPLEVRADARGLRTITRYAEGEFTDTILEAIRVGAIEGYSFRGPIYKSTPSNRPPRVRAGAALPVLTRTEMGLIEYGPTPSPAYREAHVLAMRAALNAFSTPHDHGDQDQDDTATPVRGEAPETSSDTIERSRRRNLLRLRAAARDVGI